MAMRIRPSGGGTSFYESFSDLIFGTLVLFIVLVMGLALKISDQKTAEAEPKKEQPPEPKPVEDMTRKEKEELADRALEFVAPHRFSGATYMSVVTCGMYRAGGETRILFIPASVGQRRGLDFTENNDPLMLLCEEALSPDGLFHLSLREYIAMGSGFINAEIELITLMDGWSSAVADALKSHDMGRSASSAAALRARIGQSRENQHPRLHHYQVARRLLRLGNNPWGAFSREVVNMEARSPKTDDKAFFIRFRVQESPRRIFVGDYGMNVARFRALLRAVEAGRGFNLEYDSGGKPERPPEWVFSEVFEKLGFTGRMVRRDVAKAMQETGR